MERSAVVVAVCLLAALSGCQADVEDNHISELTHEDLEEDALRDLEAVAVLKANSSAAEASSEPTLDMALKQLEALEERLAASEGEVSTLKSTMIQLSAARYGQPRVAFFAALPVSGSIGPVDVLYPLVYKDVLYNTGGHYSPITGYFTAPVTGVYYFAFHSLDWGSRSGTGVGLYLNNRWIVSWYGYSPNHAISGSNSAVVQLRAGEKVNVRLWNNRKISDNSGRYCSFSGFLLFAV